MSTYLNITLQHRQLIVDRAPRGRANSAAHSDPRDNFSLSIFFFAPRRVCLSTISFALLSAASSIFSLFVITRAPVSCGNKANGAFSLALLLSFPFRAFILYDARAASTCHIRYRPRTKAALCSRDVNNYIIKVSKPRVVWMFLRAL